MKLYDAEFAPSPRRVRIFLAEKGLTDIECIKLNLPAGENLTEEFAHKNPTCKVPVLELDNGTCISEVAAIYRYIEEIQPENPLLGNTAEEKATIEMWDRRIEFAFLYPVFNSFQHTSGIFKDRMTPVAEWGTEARNIAAKFFPIMESQLANHTYIAGESFSAADISALVTLEFAKVIKLRADEQYPNIQRWYELLKQRPSYSA
ncbi:glutathione S-transferase family protein [Bacterioplanoides sp. SCSIO 12839]|uniref:glutathione S-transferase family protein n=1 Tax=Bacterioplanoides sp. SCSIO 12839 TaxID=2829569 RepID=UPI0021042994|nr:glutathione S-transferase [Bacterioplanoides sp. SCSIO 12839]UTW47133.1 glutathione S-transferase [Bacterioplanoides sp. SCSIO 12839]